MDYIGHRLSSQATDTFSSVGSPQNVNSLANIGNWWKILFSKIVFDSMPKGNHQNQTEGLENKNEINLN